jgi:hypothetical protein
MTTYPLPGDFGILIHRHGGWVEHLAEWAISWGTDSPATHAFIAIGNGQIIEAVHHVQVSPASEYEGIVWSSGRLPPHLVPTSGQREAIVRACHSYVGEGYNVLDLVAIALAQKRLGGEVDSDDWAARRLNDDHHLICSQLVSAAYLKAGITLCPGKLAGLVSPGDLLSLLWLAPATAA